MATPWLGNILTSFTNGLLGENFAAGTNSTAKALGAATMKGFTAIPGVNEMIEAGSTPVNGRDAITYIADAFKKGVPAGIDAASKAFPNPAAPTTPTTPAPYTATPSDAGTTVVTPDYLNADLAKAYGMDTATAYQEALSNTSYQRAVKDLQAAGLNPVLAAGSLAPAGGVYSAQVQGGDQTISTGVSSAKGAHTYYKAFQNFGTLAGAGYGFFTGGVPGAIKGAAIGGTVLGALGNILDAR